MGASSAVVTGTSDGVRVRVRLTPRASRDEVLGQREGTGQALVVRVTAPAVENRANQALCKLLAKELGVAKGRVTVVSGGKSRDKLVAIAGLDVKELRARLGLPEA